MKAIHARVFMTVLALLLLSSCGDGGTAVVSDSGGTVSNPAYDDSAGQTAPVIQETEPEEGTQTDELFIRMVTAFALTNAEGESLYWDGSQLTGTMAVYSYGLTISAPSGMTLTVPQSDSFRFVPKSMDKDNLVMLFHNEFCVRVSGENIGEVFMNAPESVTFSGDGMDFSVMYSAESWPIYTIDGSGADYVTITGGSDGLSVTGLVGRCTVKTKGSDGSAETVTFGARTGNTVSISPDGEVVIAG